MRGVTAVASHPKIHAMTEIDYREYYIQNTAGTTPDAAGSRMDRDFYRGASHEEALITKLVERSARYTGARARRKDKQRPHDSGQRRRTTRHSVHANTQRDHVAQIDRLLHGGGRAATFSL